MLKVCMCVCVQCKVCFGHKVMFVATPDAILCSKIRFIVNFTIR